MLRILLTTLGLLITWLALGASKGAERQLGDSEYGVYRVAEGHLIGIDRFTTDSGENAVLFSDYQSGIVRRLFPVAETEWVMGPGFAVQSPAELTIRFATDATGAVSSISLQQPSGKVSTAKRLGLERHPVRMRNGSVSLAGTLIVPAGKGPHPAIVLLHGSGPLTRYSFGPYPHFFASLGMAVLVFDKRGAGESTGNLMDAGSGALKAPPMGYQYPRDLVDDALVAFQLLKTRNDIDPKQIGFWGSSEGGMLATQAAAREKQVAFAIDSGGFMGPLWETLQYQTGALARERGTPEADVAEALAFSELWMNVARTGVGYETFVAAREKVRHEDKAWMLNWRSAEFSSLEQMRWDWDHTLSFSPIPALETVTCPVLGIWGEEDPLTDAAKAAESMRTALRKSGNKDIATKIVANGSHSLMEMPGRARMAPGVFRYVENWLSQHVRTP